MTPQDMYNGLSQVYCIKPEGRIHKYAISLHGLSIIDKLLSKEAFSIKKRMI